MSAQTGTDADPLFGANVSDGNSRAASEVQHSSISSPDYVLHNLDFPEKSLLVSRAAARIRTLRPRCLEWILTQKLDPPPCRKPRHGWLLYRLRLRYVLARGSSSIRLSISIANVRVLSRNALSIYHKPSADTMIDGLPVCDLPNPEATWSDDSQSLPVPAEKTASVDKKVYAQSMDSASSKAADSHKEKRSRVKAPTTLTAERQSTSKHRFDEHVELVTLASQGREGVDRVAAFQRRAVTQSNGTGPDAFHRPIRSLKTVDQWSDTTETKDKAEVLKELSKYNKANRRKRGTHGEVR